MREPSLVMSKAIPNFERRKPRIANGGSPPPRDECELLWCKVGVVIKGMDVVVVVVVMVMVMEGLRTPERELLKESIMIANLGEFPSQPVRWRGDERIKRQLHRIYKGADLEASSGIISGGRQRMEQPEISRFLFRLIYLELQFILVMNKVQI